MLKAKQKLISVFLALAMLFATAILGFSALFGAPKTASAATTTVTFELGDNGTASHTDGSAATTYTETEGDYTLNLTDGTKMYTGAYDATGNSCIKLGTSSVVGGFSFTVPDDVTKVTLEIAKYKAKTTKVSINGTEYTLENSSNDGLYDSIEVDTSSTKTISVTTVSGGVRAMVNTIIYEVTTSEGEENTCTHTNKTEAEKTEAKCEAEGKIVYTCDDCGETITETIPALGHAYTETSRTNAQCEVAGEISYTCSTCGGTKTEPISALGHTYVDGFCTTCGAEMPTVLTLTFDDTAKRTAYDTTQQIWVENGITFTNNKSESTTDVGDYSNPVRLYANSEIIIERAGMEKIEFLCNTASYATVLQASITDSTISDKVVTVAFDTPQDSFSCTLGAQVRLNSITVYLADESGEDGCAHDYESVVTAPTCTEVGYTTYTCSLCGDDYTDDEVAALGHNYVDGFCSNDGCGEQDPATIDYSGYYYFAAKRSAGNYFYVGNEWDSSKDRYVATDSGLTELPTSITEVDMAYVFQLVKNNDGTYMIYEGNGGKLFGGEVENVTIVKNGEFYNIYDSSEVYFSFNNSTGNNYIKWYTSVQVRNFALVPVELSGNIDSASLTVKEDIAVNYYVTMSETFAEAKLQYTLSNGNDGEISPVVDGERYKFTLELPPHYMTEEITTKLVYNGLEIDSTTYSIQTYAKNQLDKIKDGSLADTDGKLKQLLTDMLYYGAAAQTYKSHNVEKLATSGVENIGTPSTETPEATDFTLVKNEEISSYPAYFKSATVWFDNVNQIRVTLSTTENVTMTINGIAAEVTGTTVYTEDILPADFDATYTFKLYHDGILMQTLTYSVNAYAYAMKDDAEMQSLVLALYRYGKSAEAYNA